MAKRSNNKEIKDFTSVEERILKLVRDAEKRNGKTTGGLSSVSRQLKKSKN